MIWETTWLFQWTKRNFKIVIGFFFQSHVTMTALCEQFTHRSADTIGVFPALACTAYWLPEVSYSRAAKPWSLHLQTNHLFHQLYLS